MDHFSSASCYLVILLIKYGNSNTMYFKCDSGSVVLVSRRKTFRLKNGSFIGLFAMLAEQLQSSTAQQKSRRSGYVKGIF